MAHKLAVLILAVASLTACKVVAKTLVPQGRIIGGHIAEEDTVPYQVSLQTTWGGHFCGAAIVDKDWVVTAAHCVSRKNPDDIIVFTGTQDFANSNQATYYYVERTYIHCNYDEPLAANDIALLRLNETIELDKATQIVPLATKPLRRGDVVTLTGWGIEEQYGDIVDRLKTIDLAFFPHEECKEAHRNVSKETVDVGHICTFTRGGEGSCHYDSGSPLVSGGAIVGVVNWGTSCAVGDPDVHASIYYYYNWLHTIMTAEDAYCDCHALIKERKNK